MHAIDLLLMHAAATWALVGLIWTVQLVQYPGFATVGAAELGSFHEHHTTRITWIVAPLMVCELLTALTLFEARPHGLSPGFLGTGLALIALVWACTVFVAVPLHGRVRRGDPRAQRALVASNWLRTAAWSARGAWALLAVRAVWGPA